MTVTPVVGTALVAPAPAAAAVGQHSANWSRTRAVTLVDPRSSVRAAAWGALVSNDGEAAVARFAAAARGTPLTWHVAEESSAGAIRDLLAIEGISRRRAPVPGLGPESTLDDARALLAAGINRKDFGGEIMPELGFGAGLWNGRRSDEAAASLTATCGLAAGSTHLSNASVLRFPARFGYDRNAAVIDAELDAAIRWWEPDRAWFGSDHIRDGQDGLTPSIGLLTYLARHRYVVDPRAADIDGVGIERLSSGVLLRCAPMPSAMPSGRCGTPSMSAAETGQGPS